MAKRLPMLVDKDTGEIYEGAIMPEQGDTIVTREAREARELAKKRKRFFDPNGRKFTFASIEGAESIVNDTKIQSALGLCVALSAHLTINKNGLLPFKNVNQISKAIKIDYKTIKSAYDIAIDMGIIKVNNEKLYLDESFFIMGKIERKTRGYAKMYHNGIKKLYTSNASHQLKMLGVLYLIIPHISIHSNVIAENTLEKDIFEIKPMTVNKLSTKTGIHRNFIKTMMDKLLIETIVDNKKAILPCFMIVPIGDKKGILVNPELSGITNRGLLEAFIILSKLLPENK